MSLQVLPATRQRKKRLWELICSAGIRSFPTKSPICRALPQQKENCTIPDQTITVSKSLQGFLTVTVTVTHTHYVTNVQTKKLLFYIQDAHRRQAITSCVISLSCFPPLCSFATIFTCPFVRKLYLRQLWVQKTLGFVHIHSAILIQEINVVDRSLATSRHVCILAKKVDTKKGDYNWHNWPCTESPCSAWTICHQIVSWSAPPLMGQRHLKSISFQYVMQCNYHSPVSISIQVQAGP